MAQEKMLHLGCGQVYKPGYVNVDMFDRSVADERTDLLDLPFDDGSYDLAEAFQVIEHFDLVHSRYFLAEVYRVLRPGGRLVVETPDLGESLRVLSRSDPSNSVAILQWIYGQDSPGLQHKTGFTYSILEGALEDAGFVDVQREEPQTHTYEPGTRVSCTRPKDDRGHLLNSMIRKAVRKHLAGVDSYVLFPLEDSLSEVFRILEDARPHSHDTVTSALASATVPDPRVGQAVLEAMARSRLVGKGDETRMRSTLAHLADIDLKGRLFGVWCRTRKGSDPEEDFRRFFSEQARLVEELLGPEGDTRALSYAMEVEPIHIPLLDRRLILMEGRREFFVGVKRFSQGLLSEAESAFLRSISINPWNHVPHWNLARLAAITGATSEEVARLYREALNRVPQGSASASIRAESDAWQRPDRSVPPKEPIGSYDGH